MTRRKFTSKFKTKVVLESLKEQQTTHELAQRFEITPQQISTWKREFLKDADTVFSKGSSLRNLKKRKRKTSSLRLSGSLKWKMIF